VIPIDALLGCGQPEAAGSLNASSSGLNQPLIRPSTASFLLGLLGAILGCLLTNQTPCVGSDRKSLPGPAWNWGSVPWLLAAVLGLGGGFKPHCPAEGKLDLAGRLYGIGTYLPMPAVLAARWWANWCFASGWAGLPVGALSRPALVVPTGSGF